MSEIGRSFLYLSYVLVAFGVGLRLMGYNQDNGFLQSLGLGITPRAFLMAGIMCGVLSIANSVLAIAEGKSNSESDEADS